MSAVAQDVQNTESSFIGFGGVKLFDQSWHNYQASGGWNSLARLS